MELPILHVRDDAPESDMTAALPTELWQNILLFCNLRGYLVLANLSPRVNRVAENESVKEQFCSIFTRREDYYSDYYHKSPEDAESSYSRYGLVLDGQKEGPWGPYSKDGEEVSYTDHYIKGKVWWMTGWKHGKRVSEGPARFSSRYPRLAVKYGTWKFYSEHDGSLKAEVECEEGESMGAGIRHGKARLYHPELSLSSPCQPGKLRATGQYRNDKKSGAWVYFDAEGEKKVSEGKYTHGKPSGKWTWYHSSGKTSQTMNFAKDESGEWVLEGPYAEFHEGGKKKVEGNYSQGDKIGVWREYSPTGIVLEKALWRKGKRHGSAVSYHSNGRIKEEGGYYENEKHGLWRVFDDNMKLKQENLFYDGKKEGPEKIYAPDGTVEQKNNYVADKLHGSCKKVVRGKTTRTFYIHGARFNPNGYIQC